MIKDFSQKTYFNLSINIGNINFIFLKNIKNGLISLILFKFIVDFIEQFIDFNNDPEKNYISFYQELTCQRDQDILFNKFMKECRIREETGMNFENFIKEFCQNNQYNVDFDEFVKDFMSDEKKEKSTKNFENEWRKKLSPGKAFREIFIKEFKVPLNKKSFLFCLLKSILVSLIIALIFNINVSFESFFLKNQDQIQNILNDYKLQIIFVLSFSIIFGIFGQIIKYESTFEKEKINNEKIDNIITSEKSKDFEIFGLTINMKCLHLFT